MKPMGMKFNMEAELYDLEKRRIQIAKFPGSREMEDSNLGKALRFAVLNVVENGPDGQPVALIGQQKFERYELARKLQKGGILELNETERTLVRMLVGEGFPVEAVGAIWEVLDKPLTDEEVDKLEKKEGENGAEEEKGATGDEGAEGSDE
jgi:hypothetical protein